MEPLESNVTVISWICGHMCICMYVLKHSASGVQPCFGVHTTRGIFAISFFYKTLNNMTNVDSDYWIKMRCLCMPCLTQWLCQFSSFHGWIYHSICSSSLHWHDRGRLELILQEMASCQQDQGLLWSADLTKNCFGEWSARCSHNCAKWVGKKLGAKVIDISHSAIHPITTEYIALQDFTDEVSISFKWRLCAVQQQAITRTSIDQILWHH